MNFSGHPFVDKCEANKDVKEKWSNSHFQKCAHSSENEIRDQMGASMELNIDHYGLMKLFVPLLIDGANSQKDLKPLVEEDDNRIGRGQRTLFRLMQS